MNYNTGNTEKEIRQTQKVIIFSDLNESATEPPVQPLLAAGWLVTCLQESAMDAAQEAQEAKDRG